MAYVDYWLGDAGEDYAVVMVCSDTSGTLSISSAGISSPVAVDPAVDHGVAKLTITGLAADTAYAFSLLLDGVPQNSGTVRTAPVSAGWSFGWGSCLSPSHDQAYGYQLVRDHDIRAWFALGDTPYCDAGQGWNATLGFGTWMLENAPGAYTAYAEGRIAYDRNYKALQETPGWKFLTQRVPLYRLPDDHEYGNDWDWTVNEWSALFSPALTTQAMVDSVGASANAAMWTWNQGNPTNTDPEIGNWKPANCLDTHTEHPPKYYRKTIGNVEFFHLDFYAHMDPQLTKAGKARTVCIDAVWNAELGFAYSDPAGAALAKSALGPYQLNWLLTHLASSTATFKVIVCGKVTHIVNCYSDNRGIDPHYKTERDYILAFIKRYVTGVMWIAGDVHTSGVYNDLSGHCCINSSPLGQCMFFDRVGTIRWHPGYMHPHTWRITGPESDKYLNRNTYGVVRVFDDYLQPAIYSEAGELMWTGYLKAGKNYLQPTLDEPGEWA